MITNFQTVPIDPRLAPYVQRIFILESSGRFPTEDLKLIVPNACPKLVIPFKNGLAASSKEWEHISPEHKIAFIGISDISALVDFQQDREGGSLTVEFKPLGAYRFDHINWATLKNRIYHYPDVAGRAGRELEEQLAEEEHPQAKAILVQQFLIRLLERREQDPVFDFCVQKIMQSGGTVSLRELERRTGYSARWLNMKFSARIGISPKNLASIVRFQQYYNSLINNRASFFLEKEFYHYYHDQAHFTRDFKRFTGYPPVLFSKSDNHYDSVFYKG